MERGVHDLGGWPVDEPIDRAEHALDEWEMLTDAISGALIQGGVVTADELRRGIEDMPPERYLEASYYERWLAAFETILTEKGVLAVGEVDERLAR